MILLLDIGNTRIKWGALVSGSVSAGGAVASAGVAEQVLGEILDRQPEPAAVWISNVGGVDIGVAAADACRSRWGLSASFAASAREAFGVRNGYRDPAQLGVDRWLAMLAARVRTDGPLCVVNCGTAVTFDIVAADGAHQGGYIIPGMELMARALSENTDGIRVGITTTPGDHPGRATQDCVVNGAGAAIAALLDRVVDRFARDSGAPVRCFVSGGGASALIPLMGNAIDHDPDLVLRGLARLAGG